MEKVNTFYAYELKLLIQKFKFKKMPKYNCRNIIKNEINSSTCLQF